MIDGIPNRALLCTSLCFVLAYIVFLLLCFVSLCAFVSFFYPCFLVVLLDHKCSYNYMKNSTGSTNNMNSTYKGKREQQTQEEQQEKHEQLERQRRNTTEVVSAFLEGHALSPCFVCRPGSALANWLSLGMIKSVFYTGSQSSRILINHIHLILRKSILIRIHGCREFRQP